mgnify:CR=1 FL=1
MVNNRKLGQNFFQFLENLSIFTIFFNFFDQVFDYWPTFRVLPKILIFYQIFNFGPNFNRNSVCWSKFLQTLICSDTAQNLTWNIELPSFPDEIQKVISGRGHSGRVRGISEDQNRSIIQVRKFVQMKQMISFMLGNNRWKEFDK